MHHLNHVVIRRRGRSGLNVGDQAWSILVATLCKVHLVSHSEIIDVSQPLDACISATILRALIGSTRVSLSAVKNVVARHFVFGFTF
jgi:hypothetical protein